MSAFDDLKEINGKIIDASWTEWVHAGVPNKPKWLRKLLRNILSFLGHCSVCTSLDGCYFVTGIMPKQPLHNNCDCSKKKISSSLVKTKANASCKITKFTNYVFTNVIDSKGKIQIFYDLGFDIEDSEYLQNEFCSQALRQYLLGNYILKNLNEFGQRLAIPITLKGVTFYSGWLVCPEGKIENTTPFGGWIK